ncbi:MAG: hypothetical protein QOK47_1703 [Actinomycetota bacterium]|nr:hypothetical protein [Actinomycetota bacterium]
MPRVQLALNVTNVDSAVDFYSKLFKTEPAKRRPGYANFAIDEPPLKLVLIENVTGGTLNHLGVEVETPAAVSDATIRLQGEGLSIEEQKATSCCYALQDKVWVEDPDGAPWEVYTVLADAPQDASCCGDQGATQAEACCPPTVAGSCC